MEKAIQNFRTQLYVLLLSVVLFTIKIVAWYLTGSLSILTDALESIVNIVAGIAGAYSLFVAAKPKDAEHPYGHGKAEFLSAALEGTLIILAGLYIIYESLQSLFLSHSLSALNNGMILIGASALINYFAGAFCLRQGKRNRSLALQATGKHLQTDAWSSFAIISGLLLIAIFKIFWLDKVLAMAMSVLIIYNGYKILRQSVAGIMDEADKDLLNETIQLINENRRLNWIDLHNLRVIKYGSRLHVDCHLTVPWYLNVHEAHKEVELLNQLIDEKYGAAVEMFVHTDGCLPMSCPICVKDECPVRQSPFQKRLKWTFENVVQNKKHTI